MTAFPIGYLFGFFLQKGDLCASSAISETIMFKGKKKIWGFWVAIVTTMVSISILYLLDLVQLNPKPLFWLSSIVGGIIFGVGMVFAGGCISGVSYKGATGNINSIMALMAVPLGIAIIEFDPLSAMNKYISSFVLTGTDGTSVSLTYLTNLPYWVIALIIATATIVYALLKYKRKKFAFVLPLKKSWEPWIAGLLIGILGAFAYLTSATTGRN